MEELQHAIYEVSHWIMDNNAKRFRTIEYLRKINSLLSSAVSIWHEIQNLNIESASNENIALTTIVGSDRAKKLHLLYLDANSAVKNILNLVGGEVAYYGGMPTSIIEEAYAQLNANEAIKDRAMGAIVTMNKRVDQINSYIKKLTL